MSVTVADQLRLVKEIRIHIDVERGAPAALNHIKVKEELRSITTTT